MKRIMVRLPLVFFKVPSMPKGIEVNAWTINVQNVEKMEWSGASNFHNEKIHKHRVCV